MDYRFIFFFTLFVIGCGNTTAPVTWQKADNQSYPLDDESRRLSGGTCPVVQLTEYEGDYLPYHRPLKVNPFFRERLQQFELVVAEVSIRELGETPSAIKHFGAYNCRKIKGRNKMSEHGLGNAIDVSGFAFTDFSISIEKDWHAGDERSDFLHALAKELSTRPDIFRGMLGPGAKGHDDHFHFDVGKHRYLRMNY